MRPQSVGLFLKRRYLYANRSCRSLGRLCLHPDFRTDPAADAGLAISKLGLTDVSKAVVPWLLTALVFLMLITYVPEITLVLPRMMGM